MIRKMSTKSEQIESEDWALEVSDGILIFVEDVSIDRNKNAWKTSLPTCLTKSLSPLSG